MLGHANRIRLTAPVHLGDEMVPFRERRHRIQGPELRPVAEAVGERLERLVADRTGFEEACLLLRVLYRLDSDGPGRPSYPDEGWAAMEAYLWGRRCPPN